MPGFCAIKDLVFGNAPGLGYQFSDLQMRRCLRPQFSDWGVHPRQHPSR